MSKVIKMIKEQLRKNPTDLFENIEDLVEKDTFLNSIKQVPTLQIRSHLLTKVKAFYDNYLIFLKLQKLRTLNPENDDIRETHEEVKKDMSQDVDLMIRAIHRTVTPHLEALLTAFEEAKKSISEKVID